MKNAKGSRKSGSGPAKGSAAGAPGRRRPASSRPATPTAADVLVAASAVAAPLAAPLAAPVAAAPGAKLTQAELADRLGCSVRQVRHLKDEGMPSTWPDAREWFNAREASRARQQGAGSDLQKIALQKAQLDVRRQEIELAERLGQLVPTSVVEDFANRLTTRVRARIDALPAQYALRAQAAGADFAANLAVLEDAVEWVLSALHSVADDQDDEQDVASAASSAA